MNRSKKTKEDKSSVNQLTMNRLYLNVEYCKTLFNRPSFYLLRSLNSTCLYLGQACTWDRPLITWRHQTLRKERDCPSLTALGFNLPQRLGTEQDIFSKSRRRETSVWQRVWAFHPYPKALKFPTAFARLRRHYNFSPLQSNHS